MKHLESFLVRRHLGVPSVAALIAMSLAVVCQAAVTDIASTPIVTTTAALVKPNIMLLMDASNSMGRTHMPDEVETQTRATSVGYKSAQCNALYYNPAQRYLQPKRYDGTFFPVPSFGGAPYAGFGAFYATPDTSTTDLNTQFVAYDDNTLETPVPVVFRDVPGPAYYYVYTGPEALSYATAPCTQTDTRATNATPGGGTWTRITVGAAEQENFAIWYSYYRTRIALIKSAASLAFAPLNDTKRVGFITVQPKASAGAPGIAGVTGDWPRYLPIGDFNSGAGAQKEAWFKKLFSQAPGGASPAREGLARVGRYYAGLEDSINTNMPATGAADPVQYSCQQNFTILTTDGYWNGQTESKGPGLFGGGLKLDGITKVDQQDGDLGDPYSQRPMWDGSTDSVHVVTNKTNAYTDNLCSLAGRYRSTWQTQRQVTSTTMDTTRTTKRTVQYLETKSQAVATTTQTTFTSTYDIRSTEQFALSRQHFVEEKYQHVKSQEQTTKVTEQWELTTTQAVAQTFQTRKIDTKVWKTEEQWKIEKSQAVQRTTQYVMKVDQYKYGRKQVYMHQYQTLAKIGDDEHGVPQEGDCVEGPGVHCETYDWFANQLVDPSTCTTGPGPTVGPGPGFLKTTCINGPAAVPYGAVASCPVGVTPASSLNSWTETRCDFVAGTATPINGTCVVGAPTQDLAFFIYTCTRPPATNQDIGVASCPVDIPGTDPNWITTTCIHPAATNFPPTAGLPCTPAGPVTDGFFVTTTCTKSIDTAGYAASCVANDGTATPFIKVTCGAPEVVSDTAVPSASCTPGTVGLITTSCPKTAAGPNATPTPVQTCVEGDTTGASNYYETHCDYPAATNRTIVTTAALCGTPGVTPGTASSWITRDCHKPSGANNDTVFADPRFCTNDDGSVFPFLKTTCTTVQTMAPIPVDPATCPIGTTYGGTPDFTVTICAKRGVSPPTNVAMCTPTDPKVPPFIVTSCGPSVTDTPVAFCNVGDTYVDGIDTVTCIKPAGANNTPPTQVAACTPQLPTDPNYVRVTCAGSVTTAATPILPASCPAPANGSQQYFSATQVITCYNSAAGAYPSATAVPSCTDGVDVGTLITTTCTHPAANNYTDRNVAPCTEGTFSDPNEVTRKCSKTDVTVFVPTATCLADVPQVGTGPAIYCSTTPTSGTPATSCSVGHVDATTPFDTTTGCNPVVTSPFADYAGVCTTGPTGTPGETAQCRKGLPIDVLVADAACVDGTNAGTGLITECTAAFGSGHKYSVITTTTVTTTPFSGAVAAGPGSSSSTSTSSSLVDGVCYPTAQTLTAQPIPPAPGPGTTCAAGPAYPCTAVTPTTGGSQNSLADVAQYYYKTDLRPSMSDDPANGGVPPAGSGPEDDKASHQHMTTFVVGVGVSGTLNYQPDYFTATTGDFSKIRPLVATKNWPIWPDPLLTYVNPDDYNSPKSIDDFWHTAVNGRGRYFAATDPTTVIEGLADALAKIDDVLASGSADAVSTLQPTSTNNFAYSPSYKSGVWEGDIEARLIDPATGIPGAPVWKAKDLLGPRQAATCDSRQIYLIHGGNTLSNFTWNTNLCVSGVPTATADGLDATEQLSFGLGSLSQLSQWAFMTAAQKTAAQDPGRLVNFIRGQRSDEGFQIGSLTKFFRKRGGGVVGEGILGDIVDSQPVYIAQPFANYQEHNYAAFKGTARTPMLYVGANDGMLHAFYAAVDLADTNHGQEAWAVIPSAVLPNLYKLADDSYKRDGHQFYVDGTPVAGDVWNGTSWRTILVGGLSAGGKGYYALDVTNAGALPTPLWEFKQVSGTCPAPAPTAMLTGIFADCNLGLTFGKPIITKLAGQWVVIVTSGYNNNNGVTGDGGGFVYVLDALTGELKQKIATGVGSAATPSGLAQLNNYVDNADIDNTTLRAYGGDVLGNIWRFDFTTKSATLLGTAKDASNVIEPITIRPELAELDGNPFILVGTGRLLGASDVTDSQKQSVYGLRDPLTAGPGPLYPDPLRSTLRPMAIAQTGTLSSAVRTVSCTGVAAACARADGWVLDLPEAGERVNVEMKLVLGSLVFASNVPGLVPCSVGGHSWFNQVDFRTAAPIPGAVTSEFLADSLNVGFNVLQLAPTAGQQNPTYTGLFRQSKASNVNKPIHPPEPGGVGKRISWREIAQ